MMDKLFFNGKIRTLDGADRVTEAVGIRNGIIAFLGTNQEALAIPCEERIDLKGRLMLPGFVDSHLHMLHGFSAVDGMKNNSKHQGTRIEKSSMHFQPSTRSSWSGSADTLR